MQTSDAKQQIIEMAPKIASLLAGNWTAQVKESPDWPGIYTVKLIDNLGANSAPKSIYIDTLPGDPTKAHITCTVPDRDKLGNLVRVKPTPTIKVGISRGAEVIAKEIQRRVIPGLEIAYEDACMRVSADNAYIDKTQATWERLSEAFGDYRKPEQCYGQKGRIISGEAYGSFDGR